MQLQAFSFVLLATICGLAATIEAAPAAGQALHHPHRQNKRKVHHGANEGNNGFNYHSGAVAKYAEPAKHEQHNESKHLNKHFEISGAMAIGKFHAENNSFEDYHDHEDIHHDYHSSPTYQFEYGVKDHKTGDDKNHWEERDGDMVKGSYTIKEADGTTRIVDYTADHHNGYQALVKVLPPDHGHDAIKV